VARAPETAARRWSRLKPFVTEFGPADSRRRPAVILFHGCGGVRPHLPQYAAAAAEAGFRAFVVDSYAARAWPPRLVMTLVCTGVMFRGSERTGDVVAALRGLSARPDVDPARIALAGWSHGGWAIMDLMTLPLAEPGEAGLVDATEGDLAGVRSAFLVYPYVGPLAASRTRPWLRRPRVFGVIARRDHLTTVANARRVYERVRGSGAQVETWVADGTHSFDEPTGLPPMRLDPELAAQSVGRFRGFLEETLGEA
jgi:dienelactone hydrolase